ncbi:Conserved_hypothetical protein [Hexamita inflata]|uniref:Uncharacterized protein n=1 Tax=Hexamita inflata TaxID=28002 RepID=A0AA86UXT7_9EUKA|nr:Conserved hypothetical protein [Hexamita inflata]
MNNLIIFVLSAQNCSDNFTFSSHSNSCICEHFTNHNGTLCSSSCEDFNEKLVNEKCVHQIISKQLTYTSNADCLIAFNQGSVWDGSTGCICSNAVGYAGSPSSFCTDCKRLGQMVSGNKCVACTGNQILQGYICGECSNMIPNSDRTSCVTCSSRYGDGSIFSSSGICVCDNQNGFSGPQNGSCVDCWRLNKIVSGSSCTACSGTTVFQSGSCAECPNNLVPSFDQLSCVTCASKFGEASTFSSFGVCKCTIFGFAGADNSFCVDCIRKNQQVSGSVCISCSGTMILQNGVCAECPNNLVPSVDKLSCVSCFQLYGLGSVYQQFNLCVCDNSSGFTGVNKQCESCWGQQKIISGVGCTSCDQPMIFQNGQCVQCENGLVPLKNNCVSCLTMFGVGSTYKQSGICECAPGFFGGQNQQCIDCWGRGMTVSGVGCVECGANTVFSKGECVECVNQIVFDQKCASCSEKYFGSVYANGICRCEAENGFFGGNNAFCVDCWRKGQYVGQSGCEKCEKSLQFDHSTHSCESVVGMVNKSGWQLWVYIICGVVLLVIVGLIIMCVRQKKMKQGQRTKKVMPLKGTTDYYTQRVK